MADRGQMDGRPFSGTQSNMVNVAEAFTYSFSARSGFKEGVRRKEGRDWISQKRLGFDSNRPVTGERCREDMRRLYKVQKCGAMLVQANLIIIKNRHNNCR